MSFNNILEKKLLYLCDNYLRKKFFFMYCKWKQIKKYLEISDEKYHKSYRQDFSFPWFTKTWIIKLEIRFQGNLA